MSTALAPPLEQYETRHPLPEEVWLIDLAQDQIEVYTEPQGPVYALRRIVQRGGQLPVTALKATVAAEQVLG